MHYSERTKKILIDGGIGVLPTDTIYGIVGSAMKNDVVQRIYSIRDRSQSKPMIVLIRSIKALSSFNVELSSNDKKALKKVWPGKVSVILPCKGQKFSYLHRGLNTIAFRVPEDRGLRKLIAKTGPLVAPSANREGEIPARNIEEAENYFGDNVDFYEDGGERISEPSTLVRLISGKFEIIREGAVKIKND